MRQLLVTFRADDETRETIQERVNDVFSVRYLADQTDDRRSEVIRDSDGFLVWALGTELEEDEFSYLRDQQVLQTLSAGVDHLPLDRLPEGMTILSNAGAYAEPMAEHVMAMYMALCKRLACEDRNMRDGEFNQFRTNRWVQGSRCGILGFGGIGRAVARLMGAFDVTVDAINRSAETDEPVDCIGGPHDLEAVMRRCDVLVICAPLTSETRGLIDGEKLAWMCNDGMIINVARGAIVDQRALYEHLREHPSFRAGIDTWWTEPLRHGRFELEYPLLELPNVLASPHNASMVPDVLEFGLDAALRNLRRWAEGASPNNLVDPERGY